MGLKILTVDDSKTIRLIVKKALQPFNCEVFEAENGVEGLAAATKEKPNLIILDITMPVMNGIETLGRLKADAELKNIPVIMLTAESGKDNVVNIVKMGVKDYMVKPFKGEDLIERLKKIVPIEIKGQGADTEMRKTLLRRAVEIAAKVNPELAKRLTFTAADKGTAAFDQLQKHLVAASRTFQQSGIYTMALREGTIFFGPESYPESDPMASPPGTVYRQPSQEFLQVFKDKRPVTVGPATDEYGTFVSSVAPVLDPHTDEVLMAVGVDILSEDWQASLNSDRRGPLLTILAVIRFSPATTVVRSAQPT